jgi:type II secretory pathway component PulC
VKEGGAALTQAAREWEGKEGSEEDGTPQPLVVPAPHSRPFVFIRGFVSSSTITCSLNGPIRIQ